MTTTTAPLIADVAVPLTNQDRCDRCSSQAYVRATLPSGFDLLFCGHHAHDYRPSLVEAGATFYDETSRLTAKDLAAVE
ncbi:MAG: Uncharacterized protein JWO12_3553 [Frankiales bacterium]|jgi:hypothetical protein|nr:Uncharacterized protein [Frankiales bacterium]